MGPMIPSLTGAMPFVCGSGVMSTRGRKANLLGAHNLPPSPPTGLWPAPARPGACFLGEIVQAIRGQGDVRILQDKRLVTLSPLHLSLSLKALSLLLGRIYNVTDGSA